jgi:hypothetical protein
MRMDGKAKMTMMATSTHLPEPCHCQQLLMWWSRASGTLKTDRGHNNDRQGSNINEDDNERKDNDGGDQGMRKRMARMAGMRMGMTGMTGPMGMTGTMTTDNHK